MEKEHEPSKAHHGGSHDESKGSTDVADLLKILIELQVSQIGLIAGLSSRLDTAICVLEHISKNTCEALNKAHTQTVLQTLMKEFLESILELEKIAHPESALVLEKLHACRRELLACCPPEEPEPCCEYKPCERDEDGSGSAVSHEGSAPPGRTYGAPYPPAPRCPKKNPGNTNPAPRVPTGPFRGFLKPGNNLNVLDIKSGSGGAGGDPVVFGQYTNFGGVATPIAPAVAANAADISGAEAGSVVMSSGNWYAVYSTDSGSTFTSVDPTTIFDNTADGGFCCDQIIQYAPSIDRFLWLMQFSSGGNGKNRLRLAAASPETVSSSKCTSWTYWDLTSDAIGVVTTTTDATQKNPIHWLDYPDMSLGDNYVYISIDNVGNAGGSPPTGGRIVVRIPLSDIAAGGTINFRYTDWSKAGVAYSSHVSQNTGDEAYWAGNKNNSTLTVFNWNENSTSYSWRDVGVNNWPNGTLTSTAPDSNDWLAKLSSFPAYGVIGATRRINEVWFAWTASSGVASGAPGGFNFANANVQVVKVDPTNNYKVLDQFSIWNASYAFAYPCLATNDQNEVGIALGWGGSSNYPSAAVGILGDFVVWYPEASAHATVRWGDYVTARRASPQTSLFAGFGYAIINDSTTTVGFRFDPWYVLFGRNSVINPGGGSGGIH